MCGAEEYRAGILHVDMDAFFAAVEQREHPEWRGKPVIVGAGPHERGVVSTASYEARKFGVHSAMPSREAYRLCPHGIFTPGNHILYSKVSAQIFDIFYRFTPFVEGLSCDEAFLDVYGSYKLFGSAYEIGEKIRKAIREELQLTASVGVATNKFLAKLASDMNKPDGITEVPTHPREIQRFLAPLSVRSIFGVGGMLAKELVRIGIRTIGDLQNVPLPTLVSLLGENTAFHLHSLAFGLDEREVVNERIEKSISREYTFGVDETNVEVIRQILLELSSDVGQQLRAANKYATTIKMKLRWSDFKTITRQRTLPFAICDDFSIRDAALDLLMQQNLSNPVRLIGIGVSGLLDEPNPQNPQLTLFADPATERTEETLKKERLSKTLDKLRSDVLDGGDIRLGISDKH
ncbi:MAG: DNA polymerase IV [Kiritimatiellae bacterium]|nr:DNA polymerase IV [Kiritimatiellia bacterium]